MANMPAKALSFAAAHPFHKLPRAHIPTALKLPAPAPHNISAGFRVDESKLTRCYAETAFAYDGVWNASSFSESREPTGNMPMPYKSHPALWQPDKLRYAKEIWRNETLIKDQRRQGIPGTRSYVPGKAAETCFAKTDREMKDTCVELRKYNLESDGVSKTASEGQLKAEYMNCPPIRAPTKRAFKDICKHPDGLLYSASFGRHAEWNRANSMPTTHCGVKDHKIPPPEPRNFAKWGIPGYSGCIPNVNAESGSMGGTYNNVLQYAQGLDVSKSQPVTISKSITGGSLYCPAQNAETVYGRRFVPATQASLELRPYARVEC